ncbi:MAG: hypothetical protein ACP5OB_08840, partial [Candidatus Ratteibacteria bacterium]
MKYEYRQNKDGKIAIFDLETDNQISNWFDYIEMYETIYLGKKGRKYAIFDVNKNQISDWYDEILTSPFFFQDDKEEYYIGIEKVGEEKLKWAIYHLSGKKVSKYYTYTIRNVEDLNFDTLTGTLEIRYKNGKTRKIDFEPIQPIRE